MTLDSFQGGGDFGQPPSPFFGYIIYRQIVNECSLGTT